VLCKDGLINTFVQEDSCNQYRSAVIYMYMYGTAWFIKVWFCWNCNKRFCKIYSYKICEFKYNNIKRNLYLYRITPFIAIPAKVHFDQPRCTIHIRIYYTVPVLVTAFFLKMSPRVRNMCM